MEKDYLKEEIERKAADYLYKEYPLETEDIIMIMTEGARIQQEFDSINFIQETYCIDDFEQAREIWQGMLEFIKKYPPGSVRPKSAGQLIKEDFDNQRWFAAIMTSIAPDGYCQYCKHDLKNYIKIGYLESSPPQCCDEAYEHYTHS